MTKRQHLQGWDFSLYRPQHNHKGAVSKEIFPYALRHHCGARVASARWAISRISKGLGYTKPFLL